MNILTPRRIFLYASLSIVILFTLSQLTLAAPEFSFVVFGDNRDGESVFSDLIKKVNAEDGISFAFNTGDLVSKGQRCEYQAYEKLTQKIKVKVYNVMGNHDAVYGGWRHYMKYYGKPYRSFDFRNSHFVILDNSFDRRLTNAQFTWLKRDLAATKKKNIFVFLHRPLFDPSGVFANHIMESKEKALRLQKIFERYKVNIVFSGHIHGFAEGERNGVRYVIAAGAGAPLYLPEFMGGFYHYVRVDVGNDRVDYAVKRIYN